MFRLAPRNHPGPLGEVRQNFNLLQTGLRHHSGDRLPLGESDLHGAEADTPFRIDIVNAAPGQTVSFQTMMNRLRNLEVQTPPSR